jgi:hypothetical protein
MGAAAAIQANRFLDEEVGESVAGELTASH